MLRSISDSLKAYIDTESKIIKERGGNGRGGKESNKRMRQIDFLKGLLDKRMDGDSIKTDSIQSTRLNFIQNLEVCDTLSSMPVVSDTIGKLRVLVRTLKHSVIHSDDFGWPMRNETLREIGKASLQEDEREVNKYAVQSARGIMKGLERALLSSQNEMSMLQLINGFHLAFDHNFGQFLGKGHVLDWSRVGRFDPLDIDFFMTCASQRIKTAQFVQQVIRDGNISTAYVPISSEPFRIAHSGLNTLSVFYNFLNKTYHELGEYSAQRALQQLKIDGLINVNQNNVLNILANVSIEIPDQIRASWKYGLGSKNKKYLMDLVGKMIPELKFSCTHPGYWEERLCSRMDFFGRNVMLSEVIKLYWENYEKKTCKKAVYNAQCQYEIKVVALEKLFIDQDLDNEYHPYYKTTPKYMSIVAPVWEVINNGTGENVRIIGYSGIFHSSKDLYEVTVSKGGYFLGVYSNIINSAALFIRMNGGSTWCSSGANAGLITLISTNSNITVHAEACPGSGRLPGKFEEFEYVPTHGIADYNREYIRNSLSDCFSSSQSEEFFEDLVSHSKQISALSLVSELESVEQDYYARSNYIHNCPGKVKRRKLVYYERTLKVITKQLIDAGPDDKLALTLIGGFLIGKLSSYKRLDTTLNVVSTEEYLTAVEEELEELEKLSYKIAINKRTEELKAALNEKINEAQNIIMNVVEPTIKLAEQAIKPMQDQLFATLDALLRDFEDIKKQLEEMKDELEALMPLKQLLSILQLAGSILTFIGPFFPPAGVGGVVATQASSIGMYFLDGYQKVTPMPLTPQLQPDSDEDFLAIIEKYLEEHNIPKSKQEKKRISKALGAASTTASVIQLLGGPFFIRITSDDEKLKQFEMAIASADKQVKSTKILKYKFLTSFVPELDRFSQNIGTVTSNLNGSSQSGLIVSKWGIMNLLKNMRRQVNGIGGWISKAQNALLAAGRRVPGVPEVYEKFQDCINDLQEALDVLIQLYTLIETYQEMKEFAEFIADVNSLTLGNVADIENKELQKAVQRIELSIKIDLVLEEYKKARHAFMQWVFPFPSLYITPKNDLIGKAARSFEGVVSSCRKEINKYRRHLKKYNAQSTSRDEYVYYYNFTNNVVTSKPFYAWTNHKWQDAISRLLKGESIRLKADVDMIGHENAKFFRDKAAIKFKSISLSLKAHKKSHQGELISVLKHFWISMDHSGVSHYNVNGQQFVMRDKPQSYRYNFESGIGQNTVRNKVEGPSSDFLMSPYTWWTFKLRNLTKNGFADLEKFATHVDLALEGGGTYLDESEAGTVALNELNLSEYYEIYQPGDDEILADDQADVSHRRCTQAQLFPNRSPQSTSKDFSQVLPGGNLRSNGNSTMQQRCSREIQTEELSNEELLARGCRI